jgi:hypothetical protein
VSGFHTDIRDALDSSYLLGWRYFLENVVSTFPYSVDGVPAVGLQQLASISGSNSGSDTTEAGARLPIVTTIVAAAVESLFEC